MGPCNGDLGLSFICDSEFDGPIKGGGAMRFLSFGKRPHRPWALNVITTEVELVPASRVFLPSLVTLDIGGPAWIVLVRQIVIVKSFRVIQPILLNVKVDRLRTA